MKTLFVLQRQPLREQEWLLDIFSAEQGRLSVVAGRSQWQPDLHQRYQGDWALAGDWPQLRGLRSLQTYLLRGRNLYCGLYLAELLARLLPRHEAQPELFLTYAKTLEGLQNTELPDPWLRLFEYQLLQALGYGFSWQQDRNGQAIAADASYHFIAREGFARSDAATICRPRQPAWPGEYLLELGQGRAQRPQCWAAAKQVLRCALEDLLERPLVSRELFQSGI
ncbi:MAG: DNA repair protein RecO C-terminal domain-containing protein [Saccharospirillaceae bacterium]|nr:DNA repair protein RecO C-terminal domain-containing protein [Saccharospirillaceae bacterium]MCD8530350.1 DNA repair protein RecO C-terminal domain-containing protein [Saccharospirillaceae bacterium]